MSIVDERLQIAHVTRSLDVGGQEKLLVEFARHADHARHALTFVSLTGRGRLADSLEALGGRVIALDERPGVRPGMVWRLRRLFRRERFDVVHTHDDKPLLYAAPAAWLARVPCRIHTQHHGDLPQITWRQRLLMRWAARHVNPFVCVSHDGVRYAAAQGIAAARLRVFWNGIDLERFAFHGPQPGGPAVLVARLCREKDVQNLLHAVRQVVDVLPAFRLDIAGDGPCREELVRLARAAAGRARPLPGRGPRRAGAAGSSEPVRPAVVDRGHLADAAGSDGAGLTRGHDERRRQPRGRGAWPNRRAGVAVRFGGAARGILRVAGNPDEAELFGRAGRRRVEAHFDVHHMIAQYEALYEGARARSRRIREIASALRCDGMHMKVVIIDGDVSYPATSGKRLRTLHLMLRAAQRHQITYVGRCAADSDEARTAPAFLRQHGIEPILVHDPVPRKSGPAFYARLAANALFSPEPYSVASHHSEPMRQVLSDYAARHTPDLWQFEWLPYADLLKPGTPGPILVMAHNVDTLIWQRYYETARGVLKRAFLKQQWRRFERYERRRFGLAKRVVAVSAEDARLLREQFGQPAVDVVDNGIDRAYFEQTAPTERNPRRILFLGASIGGRTSTQSIYCCTRSCRASAHSIPPPAWWWWAAIRRPVSPSVCATCRASSSMPMSQTYGRIWRRAACWRCRCASAAAHG